MRSESEAIALLFSAKRSEANSQFRFRFRNNAKFALRMYTPALILIDGENDIPASDGSGLVYSSRNVARFGYSLIVMAIYWITECLPLPVTAVLPYIFYPLLGLQSSGAVSINYMKNTNFLLLGSLMVAISIETSNLHRFFSGLRTVLIVLVAWRYWF